MLPHRSKSVYPAATVTQIGKGDRARVLGIGARTVKALDPVLPRSS